MHPTLDLLKSHDLVAKKSLGQNFLLNPQITDQIISYLPLNALNDSILEIGPGPGGLTCSLLNAGAKQVFAFEKDRRFVHFLTTILCVNALDRLSVQEIDALNCDYKVFLSQHNIRHIVGNLPYNIATELIFKWLNQKIETITVMVQKEVANRICASPGSKAYGRLSIMTQLHADVRSCFVLGPGAFTPPPKVDSAVIQLMPLSNLRYDVHMPTFDRMIRCVFGMRRKMLRKSLTQIITDKDKLAGILGDCGLSGHERPEELDLATFARLSNLIT
jgi:16S rRNA (adenine1518-N6/adenine1519-N6)-dimethyltransferase